MIRTLRVLSASARGCYLATATRRDLLIVSAISISATTVPTLFARFACSARGGGYTIRTLRVLSASVARLLPLATRFARFACSVLLRPLATLCYTVRTLRVLRAALLRSASA